MQRSVVSLLRATAAISGTSGGTCSSVAACVASATATEPAAFSSQLQLYRLGWGQMHTVTQHSGWLARHFASDGERGASAGSSDGPVPPSSSSSSSSNGGSTKAPGASTSQQQQQHSQASASPTAAESAPAAAAPTSRRSTSPAFKSGARLVQPLRRGGPQVVAQEGIVHINCSLNNTLIVLTDLNGQVKTTATGGSVGYKNAGKSSPLAAERAAAEIARRALEKGFYNVSVRLRGMGRNKQIAVQALAAGGVTVTQLREVTPTPYNGCRLPRKRRV